jgi:hypothetical protein
MKKNEFFLTLRNKESQANAISRGILFYPFPYFLFISFCGFTGDIFG